MSPTKIICHSITIGGKVITLTARTVQRYICEWHLVSFINAIFLGTPREAIKKIAAKMDNAGESIDADRIIDSIDQPMLQAMPPLQVFTSQSQVAITDFVVNNVSGSRRFGIGLPITENNRIGPVAIDGVAFQVTLTPQHKKETGP
jgi:hypothetical protein